MIYAKGLSRIPLRNAAFVATLALLGVSLIGLGFSPQWLWGVATFGALALLGIQIGRAHV